VSAERPLTAGRQARIVIDTNVLIAALTKRGGSSARIVTAWQDGRVDVVTSEATLAEAQLVLDAGWLARLSSREATLDLLGKLRDESIRVKAPRIEDLRLKDAGDRRLVEAAVAGGARYLVTTDREVLRQRGYADTEFVTPTELLRALGSAER
jgi:putative PIN family toxin of toxin-antitoxin system